MLINHFYFPTLALLFATSLHAQVNLSGMPPASADSLQKSKISFYHTTPDTLVLFGSESPLEKREYAVSKASKIFPLEYGDSIIKNFRCEGMYCGDHPFREVGTTTIKVDMELSEVKCTVTPPNL